jgi:alpha-methylacyl-CoA racemase
MAGLLDGVTVLDLASVGPAVRASGWLADYGATVIKIGPMPQDSDTQLVPKPHYYSGGRGTRTVQIDLKSVAGRDVFLRLATFADVVIESFRPSVVDRLGVGYDDVKAVNPGVVYCSTTGYGQTGDRAQWAGHDLNYLAVGGFLAGSEPTGDGKPPLPGATIADSAGGGMQAVIAILAALVARAATSDGAYLDVAVADGVLALMSLQIDDVLATGAEQLPGTAPMSGRFACYDTYPTADGRWLAVAAIEGRFWANLCRLLGLEALVDRQYDDGAQDNLRSALSTAFLTKTRDEWVEMLAASDTCVAPVLTASEAATDPGFGSRGCFADAHAAPGDQWTQLAPLLAGARRAGRVDLPDRRTTDTDGVLGDCGLSAAEIAQLRAEGAVA